MKNLGRELSKLASKHGICEEWYNQLVFMTDKDALIDMYLKGIDFCIKHDYPSNEFIRKNFKGSMEHKGIFLDDKFSISNYSRVVLLGKSSGDITCTDYHVAWVFCKHESRLNVVATNHAIVRIDAFDNSVINLNCSGLAKVTVYLYGGAKINYSSSPNAQVKVVNRNKKPD